MELRICAAEVAPVRAEPDDGAEQVTQALAGEPLAVEESAGGWARIRTAYGYPGWIREDALGEEPDGASGRASRAPATRSRTRGATSARRTSGAA